MFVATNPKKPHSKSALSTLNLYIIELLPRTHTYTIKAVQSVGLGVTTYETANQLAASHMFEVLACLRCRDALACLVLAFV